MPNKVLMKRFIDKPYGTFSIYSAATTGLDVKCPYCGKLGIVKMDDNYFYFRCSSCGKRHQKEQVEYRYQINEICGKCERHFRLDITDKKQEHLKILNIHCPYCQNSQRATVQKIKKDYSDYGEIKGGIEPFFNYPLFYQTAFDGKIIWAINQEHLLYLIDYVEADIREDGERSYQDFCGTATQSDQLPKFIKLAKNRKTISKLLKQLLEKG